MKKSSLKKSVILSWIPLIHSFNHIIRKLPRGSLIRIQSKNMFIKKIKIKSCIFLQELSKDTTIKASNGKPYPALSVFSHALKFFKDHALQELSDQSSTTILNEDIRWVITVPAIWKAPAKQFMRQASYQVIYFSVYLYLADSVPEGR